MTQYLHIPAFVISVQNHHPTGHPWRLEVNSKCNAVVVVSRLLPPKGTCLYLASCCSISKCHGQTFRFSLDHFCLLTSSIFSQTLFYFINPKHSTSAANHIISANFSCLAIQIISEQFNKTSPGSKKGTPLLFLKISPRKSRSNAMLHMFFGNDILLS